MALALGLALSAGAASAQQTHDHAEHQAGTQALGSTSAEAPLRELGNAAFAAIREVVEMLNARPDTDWPRVDFEALRLHLSDMQRFTLEAEVVERENIDGGLRVVVRGTSPEASESIRRSLHAHAPMLEEETGWSAEVTDLDEGTGLEVIGGTEAEAQRIRALGYIGLMATGDHHQLHH